jgi:3-phosphoshikimate 1-carboxyvinyltransferase
MYDIPFLDLPPMDAASGSVRLPGSKSISNRALLMAGLADGDTALHDLLDSDDTQVMLNALRTLGCTVREEGGVFHVGGIGGRLRLREAALYMGNAGTAMRPLAAALAVMTTQQGGHYELSGVPRMHQRPIGDLVDALRSLGCVIENLGEPGYPPLRITGRPGGQLAVQQPISVRGDVSSQFPDRPLMALPLASEHGDVVIEVQGELISKPYIEITLKLLGRFGIHVRRQAWQRFVIPHGSRYGTPGSLHVEGDASSASYFVALGAIATHGGAPLRIVGVGSDSIQGDIAFVDAAGQMGAQVSPARAGSKCTAGRWPLAGITSTATPYPTPP